MSDIRFNQWLHQSGTGGVSQSDGGHVGIGTTNPLIPVGAGNTHILNVGVVTCNNISAGSSITAGTFYGSGANLTGLSVDSTKIETGNTKVETIDTGSDGHIKFTTEGSERVRILANGNIGIGEDAPVAKVHIAGSNYVSVGGGGFDSNVVLAITRNFTVGQSAGLALNSGTSATSFIHLGDADDPDIGKITYDHSNNSMSFTSNANERLRIDSSGYLIAKADIRLRRTASDNGALYFGDTNNNYIFGSDADDIIAFATAGGEKLRIDSSGNLKVLTTGNSGAKIQIGNHTFSGTHFAYSNDRVGFQNNGSLTCISNCSTYNDATYPGYGLVLVQGPSTSSYNTWGICPDGPAKGNKLNFHYGAQANNIHDPSNLKFSFTGEGYALTPNSPYCMLGRGSNQSIANTTGAVIYFDTKNVDRGNNYNTSNARFTAPVAGDYLFCLIVEYSPSNGVGQCHAGMWKNGSHNFGYSSFDGWNNMGDNNRGGSMVVVANLAQNDYVQFATYHAHGSTQQLVAGRTKATVRFLG